MIISLEAHVSIEADVKNKKEVKEKLRQFKKLIESISLEGFRPEVTNLEHAVEDR